MTVEEFKSVVEYFTEEKILGFVFDNSSRRIIHEPGEFKLSDHPLDEIGCLVFEEKDMRGHTYLSVAHVENVQKVLVANDPEIWKYLDQRYLGS